MLLAGARSRLAAGKASLVRMGKGAHAGKRGTPTTPGRYTRRAAPRTARSQGRGEGPGSGSLPPAEGLGRFRGRVRDGQGRFSPAQSEHHQPQQPPRPPGQPPPASWPRRPARCRPVRTWPAREQFGIGARLLAQRQRDHTGPHAPQRGRGRACGNRGTGGRGPGRRAATQLPGIGRPPNRATLVWHWHPRCPRAPHSSQASLRSSPYAHPSARHTWPSHCTQ